MLRFWVNLLLNVQKKGLCFFGLFFFSAGVFPLSAEVSFHFRYLLCPRLESSHTSILLRLRGGSSLEQPEEEGFVHLIEHLIYRGGSQKQSAGRFRQVYRTALLGGFTDRHQADFSLFVNATETEKALLDLWDAVFQLQLSTTALQQEIDLILQEQDVHPDSLLDDYETLFPNAHQETHSPYGNPHLWKKESPERFLKRVQSFYQRVFQPIHFDLILVGKFEAVPIDIFLREQQAQVKPRSCCPHMPSFVSPSENFISTSENTFVFWLKHRDKIPLYLISKGIEFGSASFPSLSHSLFGRTYETRLISGQEAYYLFFFFRNVSNPEKLSKQIRAYFRPISESSFTVLNEFCRESAWKLFLKMESPLETTPILYDWSESVLLSEAQILQRIAEISPETILKILSAVLNYSPILNPENVALFVPQKETVFLWPSSFPIWQVIPTSKAFFQKKQLPNRFTFLHHHITQTQTESITIFVSGKCFPGFFQKWKKKWQLRLPKNALFSIKTDSEFLAMTFSFPAQHYAQWVPYLKNFLDTLEAPPPARKIPNPPSRESLEVYLWETPASFYLNPILVSYSGPTDFAVLEEQIGLFQEPSFWANPFSFEDWYNLSQQKLPEKEIPVFWTMCWKAVSPSHSDYLSLKVLGEALGTALFEWMVYETGISYEIQFSVQDKAYFPIIELSTRLLQHDDFFRLQNFLKNYPLSIDDIQRAENELLERFRSSLRSTSDSSYTMARLEYLGLPYNLSENLDQVLPVRTEEFYKKIWQDYLIKQEPTLLAE